MITSKPLVFQISCQPIKTMMSPPEFLNINDMVFERLKNPSHPIQQLHLHVHKINAYEY